MYLAINEDEFPYTLTEITEEEELMIEDGILTIFRYNKDYDIYEEYRGNDEWTAVK